jgi:hypothetical protein
MRTPGHQSRAVRWVVAAIGRHHPRVAHQNSDRMKQKHLACMAALGLLALLAGCSSDAEPARLNAASSVPAVTVQKVTQVITPLGSASVADASDLPALTGAGESMLLASDAGAEIYLAAVATAATPAPPFSAETTALALVRLARGLRPAGVSGEAFNTAIRAAAGYNDLLALVRTAGSAGTPPMRHPGVTHAVLTTLGQALQALPPTADGRAVALASALALAPDRVNAPLPFDILRAGTAGRLRLSVQGATPTSPGVLLANGLPISFGARPEDPNAPTNGLPLLPPGGDSPTVLLPSIGLLGAAAAAPAPVTVPGLGRGWNLAVYRTPGARTYDGRELAVKLWNSALQGLGEMGEACQQTVASGYPPGGGVAAWSVRERDEGFAGLRTELESGALLRPPATASAECLRQRLAFGPQHQVRGTHHQLHRQGPIEHGLQQRVLRHAGHQVLLAGDVDPARLRMQRGDDDGVGDGADRQDDCRLLGHRRGLQRQAGALHPGPEPPDIGLESHRHGKALQREHTQQQRVAHGTCHTQVAGSQHDQRADSQQAPEEVAAVARDEGPDIEARDHGQQQPPLGRLEHRQLAAAEQRRGEQQCGGGKAQVRRMDLDVQPRG